MTEIECRFSPYTDNGGTCVGVASKDCAVLVSDMRMSKGYSIHTRKSSKCSQLTSKCVIASCGMKADATTLHRVLKTRVTMYQHQHRKDPSLTAIAQMLSQILYNKRFFPYYTFNVLAGVDDKGVGGVYHYDAIGSFERVEYTTSGSGSALAHAVLDSQIQQSNMREEFKRKGELTEAQIVELSTDVLNSAAERDIYTGDRAEVYVINAAGVTRREIEMRLD